jgi:hypothetical protein
VTTGWNPQPYRLDRRSLDAAARCRPHYPYPAPLPDEVRAAHLVEAGRWGRRYFGLMIAATLVGAVTIAALLFGRSTPGGEILMWACDLALVAVLAPLALCRSRLLRHTRLIKAYDAVAAASG